MSHKRQFSKEEAHSIGTQLKIDWSQIDLEQFRRELEIELEHSAIDLETNVTGDDPNGRDPSRGIPSNFDTTEAATLGKEIGPGLIVPCHYEMFEFNTVSPQGFAESARQIDQEYYLMKCGERLDL
jgi:hypothetical protein